MVAVNLTRANFEEVVLRGSALRPVLVDFWAPWCGPCRALSPLLDRLAVEFEGRFQLAKLNTDEEQELASYFGIRGIPNCKLFVDGKIADEFTGVLPESALREFLERSVPSAAAPVVQAALALLQADDAEGALAKLEEASSFAGDEGVLLTRAEALLALHRADQAVAAIEELEQAAGRRGVRDERRLAAIKARTALSAKAGANLTTLAQAAAATPVDCAAKLEYAKALAANSDYEGALEQLMAIVKADRRFGDDVARRTMLTIFEALPADSDLVRRYRRELATALN
jgi:putative thioredoxin